MSLKVEPKYRKELNVGQLSILKLLYKYRFGSSKLLADSLGIKNGSTLFEKLRTLADQDYIGKRFDGSYKLKGMPAAYYLLPKGLRALQKLPHYEAIDEELIKYSYKDKTTITTPFITHTIKIYAVALHLQKIYTDIKIFTKREMAPYDYFPKLLPDSFVSIKPPDSDTLQRFFLNIIPDATSWRALDQLVSEYNEFFEEGGWDEMGSTLPTMLLVTESGAYERRVQRFVARKQYSLDADEPSYYTTTIKALLGSQSPADAIWSDVLEPEELLTLSEI